MNIKVIEKPISLNKLKDIADEQFGDMIKAVVDINKKTVAIGGDLHADEETILLEHGSKQENLWGINLWVNKAMSEWIEFDSMINIRPSQNNRSRSVEDLKVKERIIELVNKLVKR